MQSHSLKTLPTIATWARDVYTFTGSLMDKTDKVSHDMTQVVSVQTTAMIFTGLSI